CICHHLLRWPLSASKTCWRFGVEINPPVKNFAGCTALLVRHVPLPPAWFPRKSYATATTVAEATCLRPLGRREHRCCKRRASSEVANGLHHAPCSNPIISLPSRSRHTVLYCTVLYHTVEES
ncbi:unnamed protein product, partial [Ascophyllum nodosum]